MPGAVREARSTIRDVARGHGAEGGVLDAMALCVTEAVANVVVHAYRDRIDPGDVELETRRLPDALCVYVRDTGLGLAPRLDSPGPGLGLPLIAQFADSFEVRSSDATGTEVVMRFLLPSA